jgi:hypothetical protein
MRAAGKIEWRRQRNPKRRMTASAATTNIKDMPSTYFIAPGPVPLRASVLLRCSGSAILMILKLQSVPDRMKRWIDGSDDGGSLPGRCALLDVGNASSRNSRSGLSTASISGGFLRERLHPNEMFDVSQREQPF